jgi:hypothetical protein
VKPARTVGTDTTPDPSIGLVQAAAARRLLNGACSARMGPRLADQLDEPVTEVSSTEEYWLYARPCQCPA